LVDICGENITLYLFADDAKMYCHTTDLADKDKLQRGIEKFATLIFKSAYKTRMNRLPNRNPCGSRFHTFCWGESFSIDQNSTKSLTRLLLGSPPANPRLQLQPQPLRPLEISQVLAGMQLFTAVSDFSNRQMFPS